MKNGIRVFVFGLAFVLCASVAQAAPIPAIDGQVAGLDLSFSQSALLKVVGTEL